MLPKCWKKSFNSRVMIPTKMRFYNKGNDKITCKRCNSQIKQKKEFETNLNELKRQALNQFGHMIPYYK